MAGRLPGTAGRPTTTRRNGATGESMEAIMWWRRAQLKKDRGGFAPGDTVKVSVKVIEGEKERLQAFEGVVIRKRGGGAARLLHRAAHLLRRGRRADVPPALAPHRQIQVMKRAIVRRSKLYYLRELAGKAARLKEKRVTSSPLPA